MRKIDGKVSPAVTATVQATPTVRSVATPGPSAVISTALPASIRLEITQGAFGYPLILGKDTLVRIVPETPTPGGRSFSAAPYRVELEVQDEEGGQIALRNVWDARRTATSVFLPGRLLWDEDAITRDYRFTARLFQRGVLIGQASITAHFLYNAELRLLLVPVMNPLRPVDFRELAHGLAIVSRDFPIRAGIGPLTRNTWAGLRYRISAPLFVPARFRDDTGRLRCDPATLRWLARQLLLRQAVYHMFASADARADHVVGLVRAEQISPQCPVRGLATHRGFYSWITLLPAHTGKMLTMEIGHNLGIVSPLAVNYDPAHPFHSRNRTWNRPGLVDLLHRRLLKRAASVMFPDIVGEDADTLFEPEDYTFLSGILHQRYLSIRQKDRGSARQTLMLVSILDPEGRSAHLTALPLPPTAPRKPAFGSGYHLVFLDEGGTVLDQVGAGISFRGEETLTSGSPQLLISAAYPLPTGTTQVELRQSGRLLAMLHPGPHPPRVRLPSPPTRDPEGQIAIPVYVEDPDGDPVRSYVAYSVNGGRTFTPVLVDQAGSVISWPQELRGPERDVLLRVVASDGLRVAVAERSMRLPVGDPAPLVAIGSPLDGQTLPSNTPLPLQALAYSPIDLDLQVTWFVDGVPLPTTPTPEFTKFAPGTHRLTVVVTDAEGRQARDQVMVNVLEAIP